MAHINRSTSCHVSSDQRVRKSSTNSSLPPAFARWLMYSRAQKYSRKVRCTKANCSSPVKQSMKSRSVSAFTIFWAATLGAETLRSRSAEISTFWSRVSEIISPPSPSRSSCISNATRCKISILSSWVKYSERSRCRTASHPSTNSSAQDSYSFRRSRGRCLRRFSNTIIVRRSGFPASSRIAVDSPMAAINRAARFFLLALVGDRSCIPFLDKLPDLDVTKILQCEFAEPCRSKVVWVCRAHRIAHHAG